MSNLENKAIELQVMTCLDSLLNRANHDEYLQRIGKKEALRFLEENSKYADIIKLNLQRLESIDNANPSEALECLEQFLNEMTYCLEHPKEYVKGYEKQIFWKYKNTFETTIKQALIKAEKEHNSVNLLMQELDCKDFAELRKYARCGYERLNKKYLKWEDLEFTEEVKEMHILLNGNLYFIRFGLLFGKTQQVELKNEEHLVNFNSYYKEDIKFFNDLHLERVE